MKKNECYFHSIHFFLCHSYQSQPVSLYSEANQLNNVYRSGFFMSFSDIVRLPEFNGMSLNIVSYFSNMSNTDLGLAPTSEALSYILSQRYQNITLSTIFGTRNPCRNPLGINSLFYSSGFKIYAWICPNVVESGLASIMMSNILAFIASTIFAWQNGFF